MKKQQQKITSVLDGLKIPYNLVDICQSSEDKELMRKLVGDSKALPPQICNGNDYCGVSLTWERKNIVSLCECDFWTITYLQYLTDLIF